MLEADGYSQADNAEDADVVVLNTCCIRENADNKLYGTLGNLKPLKDANPDLQIVVAGCLAQKDRDGIQERAGHVDVVFGTHNVHRAMDLLAEAKQTGPVTEIWEQAMVDEDATFPSALPAKRATDYAGWLTIQIGCDNSCAFCIVPAVRGQEISRPFDDIVAEAEQLAANGVTEVTLLGQNVNSYGRDLSLAARKAAEQAQASGEQPATAANSIKIRPQFASLLRSVGEIDGIRRVRFTSPHPKDMTPDVFAAMADVPSVVPHLHFPLQSGSDRILSAMHRGYTGARFLEKLAAAREVIPDLAVSTDIIVGYPGETDDDFEATLEVAAAAEFDSAYTFVFSPRPGTEAAELVDQFCDPTVVQDRYERLRVVINRFGLAKYRARIGLIEEVVVEGASRKNEGVLTGRTSHNKIVHFKAENLKPGTYALVEIVDATRQYLSGNLVEVTARATHRTTIPVAAL